MCKRNSIHTLKDFKTQKIKFIIFCTQNIETLLQQVKSAGNDTLLLSMRGGQGGGGTQSPLPSPFHPTSPVSPHFPPPPTPLPSPCQMSPLIKFCSCSRTKRSQEPKLFLKIAYQRPICIFRGQKVKTYVSLFVFMLNPS